MPWENEEGTTLFPMWSNPPGTFSLSTWVGAEEIFLTVTDGCGFEATDSVEVEYNIPEIVVDVPSTLDVLCNDPFSITASATGSGAVQLQLAEWQYVVELGADVELDDQQ